MKSKSLNRFEMALLPPSSCAVSNELYVFLNTLAACDN